MGSMDTFGSVTFLGSAISPGNLFVRSGGTARAISIVATEFVSFRSIALQSATAILDNLAATVGAGPAGGGFSVLSPVTSNFSGKSTSPLNVLGPDPIGH